MHAFRLDRHLELEEAELPHACMHSECHTLNLRKRSCPTTLPEFHSPRGTCVF